MFAAVVSRDRDYVISIGAIQTEYVCDLCGNWNDFIAVYCACKLHPLTSDFGFKSFFRR